MAASGQPSPTSEPEPNPTRQTWAGGIANALHCAGKGSSDVGCRDFAEWCDFALMPVQGLERADWDPKDQMEMHRKRGG